MYIPGQHLNHYMEEQAVKGGKALAKHTNSLSIMKLKLNLNNLDQICGHEDRKWG